MKSPSQFPAGAVVPGRSWLGYAAWHRVLGSSQLRPWRGGRRREVPIWMLVVALLAGVGLSWVDPRRSSAGSSAAAVTSTESFSEVQALKDALRRLYAEHAQQLHRQATMTLGLRSDEEATQRMRVLIAEFAGTEQEVQMTHILLMALERGQKWDAWLDTFKRLAGEHPAHSLVRFETEKAWRAARLTGREEELKEILRQLKALALAASGGVRGGSPDPVGGRPVDPSAF